MTDADSPFDEWRTIMQLGRLIKSNNEIENGKMFSYRWNLTSKFMVRLENNVNFRPKKLEKDRFLKKFGWNFKLYSSEHPEIRMTKATVTWINVYHTWANHWEMREIKKFDKSLHFLQNWKSKMDKSMSLILHVQLHASIDRYLRECDYIHSILMSREFASLKALLEGKAWVIFKDRKGRRPN